ncbi:uncharacterized protein [Nicotiana sylvestris]|uniref:uncharacterized protein n=1 Tax=Nicotiana sylvestris TaxID=4096 RepID=UPI00388C709D
MEENPFADIEENIEDTNAIVPPVVGAATFKVEHGLILMLKADGFFRNSTDDDPTQHLRNFLGVCVMHKQNNVLDDALRLRCFKYSLAGDTRKWLQNLPPNSIHSWHELVQAFLSKWFLQSKKSELRDRIFFFKQVPREHLHEAWDRFKLYLVRSPNNGFPNSILLENFYMGLDHMNQYIAKNVVDGSFMDKSFSRVTQILDKMAKHNQPWHSEDTTGGITYGSPSLSNMIKENQERDQVIAGLATNVNVLTKMFTESQTKKAIKGNNTKFKDNKINGGQTHKGKATNNGETTKVAQTNLQNQSSNPYVTPKGQYSNQGSSSESKLEGEGEQVVEVEEFKKAVEVEEPSIVEIEKFPEDVQVQKDNREEVKEKAKETPKTLPPIPRPPPPLPQRLARKVDDSKLENFYDILKQLSVNIPFVEAFQEMSGFVMYLKDLITKKKTTKNEVVNMTHRVSSIIATSTVQKKEDPGAFTIPCTIGAHDFARALCDNGASINLMPLTIYKKA